MISSFSRQPQAILRADKQAEYGRVVMILDELKALGVKKVAVSALVLVHSLIENS
ncbi:ExbD/TolR family protein [Sporomusa silvacetica]|uniref:ExbD/TolR family protein n=1 Tax=Sporomusa silvacetica TaxID=55504 RepID=UPI00359F1C84